MKLIELLNCVEPWIDWQNRYNKYVPLFINEASKGLHYSEWNQSVFKEFFERSNGQCVSSLQQGYFTNEEKDSIKKHWNDIASILKEIADNQDTPQWHCYNNLSEIIRNHTVQNRKAATNRLIAGLQPKLLTTIVSENHLKDLLDGLSRLVDDEVPQFSYNDWFRCSHETLSFFKEQLPYMDYMDIITYPWQIREHISGRSKLDIAIEVNNNNNIARMDTIKNILEEKKQIILQGAPGTGKTYSTAALALSIIGEKYDSINHDEIMEKYHRLVDEKRIFFTTFHQSMDYEDFVEGLRPEIVGDNVSYYVKDGVFKLACISAVEQDSMDDLDVAIENLKEECLNNSITLETKTRKKEIRVSYRENKNVFDIRPIDSEANRKDPYRADINDIKRYHIENGEIGSHNLPYIRTIYDYLVEKYNIKPYQKNENQHNNQNYVLIIDEINRGNISKIFGELITLLESDKRQGGNHSLSAILPYSNEKFSVPSNLFIIGTMNTTDRSVGYIDYAVRRRFAFYTLKASVDAVHSYYNQNKTEDEVSQKAILLFNSINEYMMADKNTSSDIDAEDLMIGHSYFMAKDIDKLKMKLEYEIIPLLREYQKDGILMVKIDDLKKEETEWKKIL